MFRISISQEELEGLPQVSFPGKIHVITEPGPELDHAIAYLRRQKIIGFDTESRPVFSPDQHHSGEALLQLSGKNEAFLFRLKMLGLPKRVATIMASPRIVKVGAAVLDDLRGLKKYLPFKESNVVDLQKIVWEWGVKDKSVKKMAAIILGIRISKTQQLSNWEAPVLSESQEKYAATDAWVCREMYMKLLREQKNPLTAEQMAPPPVTTMTGNGQDNT